MGTERFGLIRTGGGVRGAASVMFSYLRVDLKDRALGGGRKGETAVSLHQMDQCEGANCCMDDEGWQCGSVIFTKDLGGSKLQHL